MEREGTHEEFMKRCMQLARHAKEQCLSLVGPSFFLSMRKILNYFLNWPELLLCNDFRRVRGAIRPQGFIRTRYGQKTDHRHFNCRGRGGKEGYPYF